MPTPRAPRYQTSYTPMETEDCYAVYDTPQTTFDQTKATADNNRPRLAHIAELARARQIGDAQVAQADQLGQAVVDQGHW